MIMNYSFGSDVSFSLMKWWLSCHHSTLEPVVCHMDYVLITLYVMPNWRTTGTQIVIFLFIKSPPHCCDIWTYAVSWSVCVFLIVVSWHMRIWKQHECFIWTTALWARPWHQLRLIVCKHVIWEASLHALWHTNLVCCSSLDVFCSRDWVFGGWTVILVVQKCLLNKSNDSFIYWQKNKNKHLLRLQVAFMLVWHNPNYLGKRTRDIFPFLVYDYYIDRD